MSATMNRREAIRQAALLMGGAASVPAILGVLSGCAREQPASTGAPSPAGFGEGERAIVERIADIMIPRTDTPGALDVGIPGFIATMLREVYSPEVRDSYLKGLRDFDAAARKAHGKPFLELEPQLQQALVQQFHDTALKEEKARAAQAQEKLAQEIRGTAALSQRAELSPEHEYSFVLATKQLAMLGFFTSEPGATQVLQYVAIPGELHGCIPVEQAGNGRRWAVD